jgi:hypothetical protein
MNIEQVKTFEDLERYLREFTNFSGDPVPYDYNGAFHLFLAVLDNLASHHLEADLESHEECRLLFTESQQQFLRQLDRLVGE